jgi:uncharacterized protein
MKKLLLILYIFSFPAFAVDYPEKPSPWKLVNDYAGIMSTSEQQQIDRKLRIFEDSTSIQIVVVTLTTLDGYPPADYAIELGRKWGVGTKENSNGVILLISKDERKIFIATGYGMEGIMPDALCRRIIENDIKPYFKQQQFFEGIDNGTTQMMRLAKGEYKGKPGKKAAPFIGIGSALFVIVLIFLIKIRSTRSYASLNSVPFWVAWQILNAATSRRSGRWSDFSGGRGGFGGWSGGGGGGGFGSGSFGGGSFGGGGAGGSW